MRKICGRDVFRLELIKEPLGRPDRQWLLKTYVWQDYDLFPSFPALHDFLAFWEKWLEGPLFAVTVAHSKLIKPTELRAIEGVLRLH